MPRVLDSMHFALLGQLVRRLAECGLSDDVRAAVDTLTASAHPARADQLALGPNEPTVLAERLAVWALHRASDDAIALAERHLSGDAPFPSGSARSGAATVVRPARMTGGDEVMDVGEPEDAWVVTGAA